MVGVLVTLSLNECFNCYKIKELLVKGPGRCPGVYSSGLPHTIPLLIKALDCCHFLRPQGHLQQDLLMLWWRNLSSIFCRPTSAHMTYSCVPNQLEWQYDDFRIGVWNPHDHLSSFGPHSVCEAQPPYVLQTQFATVILKCLLFVVPTQQRWQYLCSCAPNQLEWQYVWWFQNRCIKSTRWLCSLYFVLLPFGAFWRKFQKVSKSFDFGDRNFNSIFLSHF